MDTPRRRKVGYIIIDGSGICIVADGTEIYKGAYEVPSWKWRRLNKEERRGLGVGRIDFAMRDARARMELMDEIVVAGMVPKGGTSMMRNLMHTWLRDDDAFRTKQTTVVDITYGGHIGYLMAREKFEGLPPGISTH